MGRRRELKRALEGYWSGAQGIDALTAVAHDVRRDGWEAQRTAGIDRIPVNDFTLYDHVLDAAVAIGAVPERYRSTDPLATYFAMARGSHDLAPLEMTKWFDTNYHFIIPEVASPLGADPNPTKLVEEYREAEHLGIPTQPAMVGPLTFALLAKPDGIDRLAGSHTITAAYARLLRAYAESGITSIRFDEPCLVLDLDEQTLAAYGDVYKMLANAVPGMRIALATYFGPLPFASVAIVAALPIDSLHLDLTRGPQPFDALLAALPATTELSLGVVDGRNVWRTNLASVLRTVDSIVARREANRVAIAPSCSLLHVPHDLDDEIDLAPDLRSWLAFGKEKLREVRLLTDALNHGRAKIAADLEENEAAVLARARSSRVHRPDLAERLAAVIDSALTRPAPFLERRRLQAEHLALPALPTTTIGSFPQTPEVRKARADFRAGRIDRIEYERFLQDETERTIRIQEDVGLDVLVHGEFERNDMVEYFAEQLDGFAFTGHGWVQSYGSRCVKPPIIFGDVVRTHAMTVAWSSHAQSLTDKPVKGMLTGPVTILEWSFVRDDQPRELTARQIALAIRDEVTDLEAAGITIIQIDEPGLREGLPLREEDRAAYLRWAVDAFRLASSSVQNRTQIHTHMCYADFDDILPAIVALDADVISIESSRSNLSLLASLAGDRYPNQVGPGVYDIHSPRIPSQAEIAGLIERIVAEVPAERVWINPDCGLKTRDWPETVASLRAMVAAAQTVRKTVEGWGD